MVKIIKLVTAEELIGEVIENKKDITIKQPCAIAIIPTQSSLGQHSMGLIPYAGYTKDHSINISNDKVVWSAEPATELYNKYNEIFGSGIQIV